MNPRDCQAELFEKYDEMKKGDANDKLAAPFLSVADSLAEPSGIGTILLVGKATKGDWKLDKFEAQSGSPIDIRIEKRRKATRDHLDAEKDNQSSAFWRFWMSLHQIGSPVIWTNRAKIGVVKGNPSGANLRAQVELARDTLNAEVAEYGPSLVVIVGDYAGDEIICPVFGLIGEWKKDNDDGVWWIDRTDSSPAVLWTGHPERKRGEQVARWLDRARALVD